MGPRPALGRGTGARTADLLAGGDELESAEGQTGGMRSDGKVETGDGSRLADVPGLSAAPIADIHASSWPSNARRKWPRTR